MGTATKKVREPADPQDAYNAIIKVVRPVYALMEAFETAEDDDSDHAFDVAEFIDTQLGRIVEILDSAPFLGGRDEIQEELGHAAAHLTALQAVLLLYAESSQFLTINMPSSEYRNAAIRLSGDLFHRYADEGITKRWAAAISEEG